MADVLKRIHATAPIRICDIGGWTDTWFARFGAVFNIAVTPNVEVQVSCIPAQSDRHVTFHLENLNDTFTVNPDRVVYGGYPILEAVVAYVGVPSGLSLEIDIFSQAPPGASVGSSAAMTVALLGALIALTPRKMSCPEIAATAHHIETEKAGLQSGIQDQYGSACGGINLLEVPVYPEAIVHSVEPPVEVLWELQNRLVLVYVDRPHSSCEVHKRVIVDLGPDASSDTRINGLRWLAAKAVSTLQQGDLAGFGDLMNRNTDLQRSLHTDLVSERFEEVIRLAETYDALGCKVNGAGGDGGSITILGDGDAAKKRLLIKVIETMGFLSIPISLSPHGLRVWQEKTLI
ncbi:MAG: GHMP kinase [Planctomycetes bacterium]|nr:GHMP kinase [Planctomycetota bacterium]